LICQINADTDWSTVLPSCSAIVHLAARVHKTGSEAEDIAAFVETNRDGTTRLAAEAVRNGIRRLVYVSTAKVCGEGRDTPYREIDAPAPQGAYALSKYEAEQGLLEIAARTGLEVVILRPPLVYGPGVGGNFRTLMKWVGRGIPLPLASVRNQRSLVGVTNLASAILQALESPAAAGRTYFVSDQHDLSTPELIERLAQSLGRTARLFPFPVSALKFAGTLLGRQRAFEQLSGSLSVDSSAITRELGWQPMRTVDEELAAAAASVPSQRAGQ
jgi:nucleoside-diphosphate-sugar epimerase